MKKTAIIILVIIGAITAEAEINFQIAIHRASQQETDGEIQTVMHEHGFKTATGTPADQFNFKDKLKALIGD
jgi:uncharacterized protein YpmB